MSQAEPWRRTILLVEDDGASGEVLRERLTSSGYTVWITPNAAVAETMVASVRPDLVLINLAVSAQHGLVVCANLKEILPGAPILVCCNSPGPDEAVLAFKLGAADFIAKPFSLDELEIRIERALRSVRGTPAWSGQTPLTLGPLQVDAAQRIVTLAGKPIRTTPTEYRLLELLVERADEVVSVRNLCQALSRDYDVSMEASIRVHLRRLRAKLRAAPAQSPVLLVARGFGYRLTWSGDQ